MNMLVKLKSESGFFENLKEQIGYVKYGSGKSVVIEYKSKKEWEEHLKGLLRHRIHLNYVNQIESLRNIMSSENLPMVVASTDNENVIKKLEKSGFEKLERVVS